MGLIEQARQDVNAILTDLDGFGQNIILTHPNGTVITTVGLHKKIRLGVDTEGNIVNSLTATVTISDSDLIAKGYPYRNSNNEVDLNKHKVSILDVTGIMRTYMVQSWHPDETLGLIVCYLNYYNG